MKPPDRGPQKECARLEPGTGKTGNLLQDDSTSTSATAFAVIAIKPDGRRILYSRCASHQAAMLLVAALARLGLHAEVATGDALPTRPGTEIRPVGA